MALGASVHYAELDGAAVCILDDGQWCEQEMDHEGAHVLRGYYPDEEGNT